ncbi:hypothetical protein H920_06621 [Fukomys damarensis]|uniref:Uncharacterized protein n=1 Tax=Fukomys damarensis TaxID=885580 RepID=A0A091DLR9_FUKDA|nr:hypothetical protein H920_06621 [Fukomys damarensis]
MLRRVATRILQTSDCASLDPPHACPAPLRRQRADPRPDGNEPCRGVCIHSPSFLRVENRRRRGCTAAMQGSSFPCDDSSFLRVCSSSAGNRPPRAVAEAAE